MPFGRTPDQLVRIARTRLRDSYAQALVGLGGAGARVGRRLVLRAYADEHVPVPKPLAIAGRTFDVVDDLGAYTGLGRPVVEALMRRELDSFRSEWFLTPARLRTDDWYYRSTSAYLFGNAVHVHEDPGVVDALAGRFDEPGVALEFGGGTGNLSLALAAHGWQVDYLERSAIQKDFTRFRADRHDLAGAVRILDDWTPLPKDRYDLVVALDVLEHIADLRSTLATRLVPSLRSRGVLAESSPFVRTLTNPMHHVHHELDRWLGELGLVLEDDRGYCRLWRRS